MGRRSLENFPLSTHRLFDTQMAWLLLVAFGIAVGAPVWALTAGILIMMVLAIAVIVAVYRDQVVS